MKAMKIMIFAFLAGVIFFFLTGITSAHDITIDFDHKFDFKTLKTFAVKVGTSWGNPISEKRVVEEIELALIKKGWTKAEENTADALVMVHGASEEKKELNTFYTNYGGWYWRGWGTAYTTVYTYKEGTLVVDIFDSKSKELVFRGVAVDKVSRKPEKNQKKIQKALADMFEYFPPGSRSK